LLIKLPSQFITIAELVGFFSQYVANNTFVQSQI